MKVGERVVLCEENLYRNRIFNYWLKSQLQTDAFFFPELYILENVLETTGSISV